MNHHFFRNFFFLLIFSGSNVVTSAQRLDSLVNELGTKYPQEKIYVQYDRPYYNPGETIWFKAYLSSDNTAAAISKTVYAELINDKGLVLQKKTMPVIESGAASFFDLPDSGVASIVYVRCYTAWMLNFDSSLLYLKPIGIISNTIKKTTSSTASYSINFFPEGGDLVEGIESLVAFKATDQSGNPVAVSGNITGRKGNKIAAFTSVHNGMGTFSLKPSMDEIYKAIWKDKKGVIHEAMLPVPKKTGVVLSVINVHNKITYTLKRPESAEIPFTSFFVVAQTQQQLVYSAKVNLVSKQEITSAIPTDSLGTGVVQITVFNADEIPLAERIVFINHNDYYFNSDLHAIELNLNKRKHNTLQVDVGGSIVTNLSISVTDESLSPARTNIDNIYSTFLLSSDLKGNIYNPAYYFSSEEDSVAQQLDLVMLTNGWRRFKWENLLAGKWPRLRYQPDNYISIAGNVYGPSPTVLRGKEISGILKTKSSDDVFTMPVSQDGKFEVTGLMFFDTAKLYYQFNQDKERQLTSSSSFTIKTNFANPAAPPVLFINSFYSPMPPDSSIAAKNKRITKLISEEFTEGKKIKSLEAVVLKTKLKTSEQKLDEKYTSGFFTGGDATIFDVGDDPLARSSLTVLNYLQAKVGGLQISVSGSTATAQWRGKQPGFFLNESSTQLDQIQTISMNDVAMIKVFRPPFFSASSGGEGGAIAVYLKKGESRNSDFKGLDFIRLNGYSTVKEFYSPDYEKLADNAPANDYRTTLYWNPFLLMDQNSRRVKIPFYNSDGCKKIRVIIEGLNRAGQLTREEKVFE